MENNKIFWCEKCAKKIMEDNLHSLLKIKKSDVQKTIPNLNQETQKKVKTVFRPRKDFYKCPNCGHVVKELIK
jgi:predicted RNA-binding Zn-ribbon protein involved in translation (DUF1610 family)